MSNELLVIEKLELVPFFTKGDQLDDTLENIAKELRAHVPDVSTLKGRNAIKANVTKGTKAKTFLEGHGKDLSAEYKAIPKVIDANRKKSRDFFTALIEEIREPLTAWEVIDKAGKQQVIDVAAYLIKFDADLEEGYRDNELFDFKLAKAEADRQAEIKAAADKAAAEAKAKAELEASEKIAKAEREKIAAEQREIAAKQAVIDAENKAAQDAINAAAREAKAKQDIIDAKAKAEKSERERLAAEEVRKEEMRVDYHKRMVQHIVDCGNGFIGGSPQSFGILFYELENKIVIDEKFEEFQQEAEAARNESIQKLKNCQEKQAKDREDAEAKTIRDNEIAAENARLAEVQRQNNIAEQQNREQAKLEADKNHVASIKRDIMADFISIGLDDTAARLATRALAAKKIRHTGISY